MQITAQDLTGWLRTAGTLATGRVDRADTVLEFPTPVSTLTFLHLGYSADAPAGLPTALVVKRRAAGAPPNVAAAELAFYRQIAPSLETPPLVRCLAAIGDDEREQPTLVLEDLRTTHDQRPWPLPPSRAHSAAAIDALAKIHARWWEHSELGKSIGAPHTTRDLTSLVSGVASLLPAFFDAVGDAVSHDDRRIYERVFGSSLQPWLRLTDATALAVTHGDAHSWNFLFPRSGDGPAVLIDWQLWHLDVGARDLAFFIALHWSAERRRELDTPLLRRYHERLGALGVHGYSLDDLVLDYRRGAVRNLTVPVLLWSRGSSPAMWYHRLECALAAYRDLGCDDVLDASFTRPATR